MKIRFLTLCLMVSIVACKSKPDTAVTQSPTVETAPVNVEPAPAIGAAEIEPEVDPAPRDENKTIVVKKREKGNTQASTVNNASGTNPVVDHSPKDHGTGNATASGGKSDGTSGNAAEAPATETTEKKKWSGTAKGAVIGGVTGAAAGAVINKKNRAVGAVVGGVIGAGTGAVIGKQAEKKEGGN
jgi:hypothetical protein